MYCTVAWLFFKAAKIPDIESKTDGSQMDLFFAMPNIRWRKKENLAYIISEIALWSHEVSNLVKLLFQKVDPTEARGGCEHRRWGGTRVAHNENRRRSAIDVFFKSCTISKFCLKAPSNKICNMSKSENQFRLAARQLHWRCCCCLPAALPCLRVQLCMCQ